MHSVPELPDRHAANSRNGTLVATLETSSERISALERKNAPKAEKNIAKVTLVDEFEGCIRIAEEWILLTSAKIREHFLQLPATEQVRSRTEVALPSGGSQL